MRIAAPQVVIRSHKLHDDRLGRKYYFQCFWNKEKEKEDVGIQNNSIFIRSSFSSHRVVMDSFLTNREWKCFILSFITHQ